MLATLRATHAHGRAFAAPRRQSSGGKVLAVRFKPEDRDSQGGPIIVYTGNDPVHGGICPYSQAVLIALLEKQQPFKAVKVDLSRKTPDFIDLYHSIFPDTGDRERVPLLADGPALLAESAVIVEYLERQYAKCGTPLLPDSAAAQAKVKLFIQFFMERVVPAYSRLLHAEGTEAVAGARDALMLRLEGLDTMLHLHGLGSYAVGPHFSWTAHGAIDREGPYLLGPYYTMAEVSATPFVARMVQVLPEWRGMDVIDACRQRRLERAAAWMEGCLARPSAKMTDPTSDELLNGMAEWEWAHAMQ